MGIVLKVENVSKQYRLGTIGTGTLSHDLNRYWAKVRGKEDPYLKVGEVNDRTSIGSEYVWALKDISFEVAQGEVLGVIGKNGAGKSTLLKLLSRVTSPTSGEIKVKGRIASLLEVGTGFHPELTGRENIYLNGTILGMNRKEISNKFDQIVEFSGIGRYIDTPVKRYSSGMYVRLAFSVAAHLDPEILVIDEVLAVGDADFQRKCIDKMESVAREGRTVIFVSHNMNIIRNMCSRSVLLHHGELIANGNTEEVINEYISKSFHETTELKRPNEPTKDLCITGIFVDTGMQNCEINYNRDFNIRINYVVNKPVKNTIVWLAFRTFDDVIAFGSCEYDLNHGLLNKERVGNYNASVTIPGRWLNQGKYKLIVGAYCTSPKVNYDRMEDIHLSIVDDNIYPNPELSDRTGIFKPFLKWDVKHNNQ